MRFVVVSCLTDMFAESNVPLNEINTQKQDELKEFEKVKVEVVKLVAFEIKPQLIWNELLILISNSNCLKSIYRGRTCCFCISKHYVRSRF